ncbi:MAG: FliI/YscN family ATPase [Planctomycetaceae bacterium]|nr:FliI/YscN family ATPase [Planctomycetales bacterium]MCB9924781.1 FliI/YscN family ATPase [Planctomycetaceae bacterium]
MNDLVAQLDSIQPAALRGSVVRTEGMMTAVAGLPAPVGAIVEIQRQSGPSVEGEVIGFRDELTLVYPFSSLLGVRRGTPVRLKRTSRYLRVGEELLGRVIDARGRTTDHLPKPALPDRVALDQRPPIATERPTIDTPLSTGIRAIDGMLTCGCGQRVGVFAGSGVGKSVTLGMMARYTSADINVIALIGERGREVNEFIKRDLGPEGLARSVVVVATSDEPALLRLQAAMTATAVAEYFRDQGKDVLLLMDSLTRFAMAQREIGLAAGEPPATRGYPPSMFGLLPKLVERAGRSALGSITAFYSVLVEGDDTNEPVSDTVRGLLDGHIILSREIASRGHYPAIDILQSLSRLMPSITSQEQRDAAQAIRELMAIYRDHEDLISIGAYRQGSNRAVDAAILLHQEIDQFLRQRVDNPCSLGQAVAELVQLGARCNAAKSMGSNASNQPPVAAR